MFDKFGEFNSAEELNMAAAGQKEQGDLEALIALAIENGLDKEDAEDYMDGLVDELATPCTAALGKIKVESEELKPKEIMEDWVEYIKVQCIEKPEVAERVREKGKTLKGCIAQLLKWSFSNAYSIPDDISSAAGIKNAKVKLGIPGMGRAKKIIDGYYTSKEDGHEEE
jgi:hypothetical protein